MTPLPIENASWAALLRTRAQPGIAPRTARLSQPFSNRLSLVGRKQRQVPGVSRPLVGRLLTLAPPIGMRLDGRSDCGGDGVFGLVGLGRHGSAVVRCEMPHVTLTGGAFIQARVA